MTIVKAQERFVTANNLRLRYVEWGTVGKTPLVCLHGQSGHAHVWDEFAEAMSPYYHIYALDQRGRGGSQWATDGYERDRFVEDLAGFLDALSLRKVILVGASMGGWNSLLYTPSHQDRVERIILVDIGPERDAAPTQQQSSQSRTPQPLEFENFQDAVTWSRQSNPRPTDARIRKDASDKLRQREDGKWVWKADPAIPPLSDANDPELIARYWRSLEAITCPILEVRGGESAMVSDRILERMKRVNPRISAVVVEGAAHLVTVDRPQGFIAATRAFLGVPG
ncbi:MAG: hydrolase-1 protein [Dehalococcoidia bacterium]|nr:hydrolase-1 protein [Dehalococcoidia bacterium]